MRIYTLTLHLINVFRLRLENTRIVYTLCLHLILSSPQSGFYHHQLHLKLLSPYTTRFLCSISSSCTFFPWRSLFPCITWHSTPLFLLFLWSFLCISLPEFSFSAHTAHIGIPHGDVLGCLLDLLAHSQWFHHPCGFNHGLCLDESQLFPGNTNPIPLSWATDPHAWHPIVYLHWISPRNLRPGDVPQSKLSTSLLLSPNLLLLLYSSSAWM